VQLEKERALNTQYSVLISFICSSRRRESPKYSILNTDFVHLQLEKERAAQAKAAGEAVKDGDVDLLSFDDEDLALATFDALIDDVSAWFGIWGTVLI